MDVCQTEWGWTNSKCQIPFKIDGFEKDVEVGSRRQDAGNWLRKVASRKWAVEVENYVELEPISFNANIFANILNANKECQTASLKISKDGLSKINFNIDDYSSEYYLVASQQVN